MIGSIRSIFWLFGRNDLVRVVDDPACLLKDEIIDVPRGINPVGYLINYYSVEGKIPSYIQETDGGVGLSQSFHVAPAFGIPNAVTTEPAQRCIANMYPLSRPQAFPETVLCLKIKNEKKIDKTINQVKKKLGGTFNIDGDKLWFRGLSMVGLTMSMSFFLPVINSNSADNEFGPGIYATDDFVTALKYARPSGAVMVFKDPDLRDLDVWRPDLSDWQHFTANWIQIPIHGLKVPDSYKHADVIIGPLSTNQSEAKAKKCFTKQSEELQFVCTSCDGSKRLAASLVAIVYLTA